MNPLQFEHGSHRYTETHYHHYLVKSTGGNRAGRIDKLLAKIRRMIHNWFVHTDRKVTTALLKQAFMNKIAELGRQIHEEPSLEVNELKETIGKIRFLYENFLLPSSLLSENESHSILDVISQGEGVEKGKIPHTPPQNKPLEAQRRVINNPPKLPYSKHVLQLPLHSIAEENEESSDALSPMSHKANHNEDNRNAQFHLSYELEKGRKSLEGDDEVVYDSSLQNGRVNASGDMINLASIDDPSQLYNDVNRLDRGEPQMSSSVHSFSSLEEHANEEMRARIREELPLMFKKHTWLLTNSEEFLTLLKEEMQGHFRADLIEEVWQEKSAEEWGQEIDENMEVLDKKLVDRFKIDLATVWTTQGSKTPWEKIKEILKTTYKYPVLFIQLKCEPHKEQWRREIFHNVEEQS